MRPHWVRTVTTWKQRALNTARRRGWEVRRLDPFLRLEDYLHYVLFPFLGINCVLDVGAHVGEYGQRLRDAGYRGEIVSFEPVASTFDALARRAARDPHWRVHNIGLSETNDSIDINVAQATQFSSLRQPRHDVTEFVNHGNVVAHHESITVRRLDSVFDEVTDRISTPRAFLKMDTQGWDLQVTAGATGVLDRIEGLQSELSILPIYDGMPDYRTSLSAFGALDFEMSTLFPVSRDRHLRLVEFDCVFTRSPVPQPQTLVEHHDPPRREHRPALAGSVGSGVV